MPSTAVPIIPRLPLALGMLALCLSPWSTAAAAVASNQASTFYLAWGQESSPVSEVAASGAAREVATQRLGADRAIRLAPGALKPATVEVQVPHPLADGLLAEVNRQLAANGAPVPPTTTAGIYALNHDRQVRGWLELHEPTLVRFSLPACQADASHELGTYTLTFASRPGDGLWQAGGTLPGGVPGQGPNRQRLMSNSFRLTIPGVDCSRVSAISAPTWTSRLVTESATESGAGRTTVQGNDGAGEVEPLTVTVAESGIQGWNDWFQDTTANQGRTATIAWLSPDQQTVLLQARLDGVLVQAIQPQDLGNRSERTPQFTVTLRATTLRLEAPGTPGASTPPTGKDPGKVVPSDKALLKREPLPLKR